MYVSVRESDSDAVSSDRLCCSVSHDDMSRLHSTSLHPSPGLSLLSTASLHLQLPASYKFHSPVLFSFDSFCSIILQFVYVLVFILR